MFEFLTLADVLETHREQIETYGGMPGLRDLGLLESALAQPAAQFEKEYLHPDIFLIAAAYLFHLVQNHPFLDGNKRVGLEAALLFLEINWYSLEVDDESLTELVLDTAQSKLPKERIADFFREHSIRLPDC